MRKLIIAGMAVAMLAIPAVASADVPRYQTQDATFTVTTPSGAGGLWTTKYKVTNNPCDDTFTGKGVVNGLDYDGEKTFNEDVKGTFNSDGTVSLTASRDPLYVSSWSLTNAPMDGSTETQATTNPTVGWTVKMKVTAPEFGNKSTYKNHGQYVKAMGGGDDAAHSCIGMPLNSTQGK